jgi:sugar lactone lactonase YvrE
LYVADMYNHAVRKITSSGNVSTVAGGTGVGSTDGLGSNAKLNYPNGVALDLFGNLIVADTYNHALRKITPSTTVSTIAGVAQNAGSSDGLSTSAKFNTPWNMAADSAGNIFVADSSNHTIRKIDSTGLVSTFAGLGLVTGNTDGMGGSARFSTPSGIVIDRKGNIFVADRLNHTIRKILPTGAVSTFAGTSGVPGSANAIGTAASFNNPSSLAVDAAGNLIVADQLNHTIRSIAPDGAVTTIAGLAGIAGWINATGTSARFNNPNGVAVDSNGNIFVSDFNNQSIRKIAPGGAVTTFAGTGTLGSTDGVGAGARFYNPAAIAIDTSDNLYVADQTNSTVRKITPAAAVTTVLGVVGQKAVSLGPWPAQLNTPRGLAIYGGVLFISDENGIFQTLLP